MHPVASYICLQIGDNYYGNPFRSVATTLTQLCHREITFRMYYSINYTTGGGGGLIKLMQRQHYYCTV
jgi:hypothetical protein